MPMILSRRYRCLPLVAAMGLALTACDSGGSVSSSAVQAVQQGAAQLSSTAVAAETAPATTDAGGTAQNAAGSAQAGKAAASAGAEAGRTAAQAAAGDADKAAVSTSAAADDKALPPALKVAFVLTTPPDGSGWTMSHQTSIDAMREQLGDKVEITVRDNVPDTESEKVFRELAQAGNRLIIGTGGSYRDVMQRLGREFPDVRWEVIGLGNVSTNVRTYAVRSYEGAYLAGVVAGKLTKTDTLGFIATVPIPEVVRNINAYALGAQSVNPAARVKVAWLNGWVDPVRETEAAQSLINSGADVLLPNSATSNPLKVAERAGVMAFGWGADMSKASSKAHVGAVGFNWRNYYVDSAQSLIDKRWKATPSWSGVRDDRVGLIALSDKVPEDVQKLVEQKTRALADGSLQIFKGPLLTADDRELLPAGKVGNDAFLFDLMSYVKGVDGQVPSTVR